MSDVILVNPNCQREVYQQLSLGTTALEPPLWCRLIAAYLRGLGVACNILDAEALCLTPHGTAEICLASKAKLIVLVAYGHQPSASTQQMVGVRSTANAIRRLHSGAKIAVVGGHVSALPVKTLLEEPVDFAIVGEGPITIAQLVNAACQSDYYNIPGLVFRETGGYISANRVKPSLVMDLSAYHDLMLWNELPLYLYRSHNWQAFGTATPGGAQPYASVFTSLGCPYHCSFCCINAPFGKATYRRRKALEVVEEIEFLYTEHGIKTFKFTDEMFVLNKTHVDTICTLLSKMPFAEELNIWAYSRIDTVSAGNLDLMRQAGIRWLALGIESVDETVRDGASKSFKTSDVYDVIREVQSHGINVIGNFIFGLPGDTKDRMFQTLEFARSLNVDFPNFYSAMAYPGSKLYVSGSSNWAAYSQHSYECEPVGTEGLSPADVLRFRDSAFYSFFGDPDYQRRTREKFGEAAYETVRSLALSKPLSRRLLGA